MCFNCSHAVIYVSKKDEREELPNEEIVKYFCCYRWYGLIPRHFHYLTKKKKNRLTNSNFREMEEIKKKLSNEYKLLFIPRYLYSKEL